MLETGTAGLVIGYRERRRLGFQRFPAAYTIDGLKKWGGSSVLQMAWFDNKNTVTVLNAPITIERFHRTRISIRRGE
jgi:hypothetical protein